MTIEQAIKEAIEKAVDEAFLKIEKRLERQDFPEVMTIKQIAKYLNVSEQTVRNKMKTGLPYTKKLGDPRFIKSELDKWLSEK